MDLYLVWLFTEWVWTLQEYSIFYGGWFLRYAGTSYYSFWLQHHRRPLWSLLVSLRFPSVWLCLSFCCQYSVSPMPKFSNCWADYRFSCSCCLSQLWLSISHQIVLRFVFHSVLTLFTYQCAVFIIFIHLFISLTDIHHFYAVSSAIIFLFYLIVFIVQWLLLVMASMIQCPVICHYDFWLFPLQPILKTTN